MFKKEIEIVKIFLAIAAMSDGIEFHSADIFEGSKRQAFFLYQWVYQRISMGQEVNFNILGKPFQSIGRDRIRMETVLFREVCFYLLVLERLKIEVIRKAVTNLECKSSFSYEKEAVEKMILLSFGQQIERFRQYYVRVFLDHG